MKKIFVLLIGLFISLATYAKGDATIVGTITDKKTNESLPAATIALIALEEPEKKVYITSDMDGRFTFENIKQGDYILQFTYVGYKTAEKSIKLNKSETYKVAISLEEDIHLLNEVSVDARATRALQRGDSMVYKADAFKVLQGSTTEDLLAKMPGIVVEGGTVQAQGEEVKKILLDGREFFDGDVNLAIKNLPADIISSIEVFDKKSDQAEFTGFDDGEEIKTINIVTKAGFRKGTFGEVYGGYGTEDRYRVGGNINIFDDESRISILGMSNNVNQQNFSQEDLAGVMSSSQSGRRGGGGGGGGNGKGGGGRGPGGSGGSSANNFMIGNLGGITSTNGLGVNYVDQWKEKVKFTGSYFFNQSTNDTRQESEREYFGSALPGMTYSEFSESQMENWNHRISSVIDYQIDKNNSLHIRPTLSFQDNTTESILQGANLFNSSLQDDIENSTTASTNAYNAGLNINFRHRFPVEGRTLSLMVGGKLSNNEGDSYADYLNRIYGSTTVEDSYSQYKVNDKGEYSVNSNLMYTEKLWDNIMLQASYRVSFSDSESDRKTYSQSAISDLYDQLDESLSSTYESDYLTQSAGIGLRLNKGNLSGMLSTNFQWANLQGDQLYPQKDNMDHNYFSVLPSLMARYSLDRNNSFFFRYRSSSAAPSISDLQAVIDNTNPLFMSTGNPDLDHQLGHSLNLRYTRTSQSGQTFIAMLGGTVQNNFIADSTFVAVEDIQLSPTITLNRGSQFTKPINMDGYYSLQTMLTYGFPVDFIRSNINMSVSANYANIPTILDGVESKTRELNLTPKIIIGSNISEKLDFTVSYSAGINQALNSEDEGTSSDYINHSALAKFGWIFGDGFTLRSTFNYIGYSGLENDEPDYFLWNASIGKKFLKNDVAEVKLEAFDLLRENQAFSRQVGSNYYDYINSNVLEPYLSLSFVYTIR